MRRILLIVLVAFGAALGGGPYPIRKNLNVYGWWNSLQARYIVPPPYGTYSYVGSEGYPYTYIYSDTIMGGVLKNYGTSSIGLSTDYYPVAYLDSILVNRLYPASNGAMINILLPGPYGLSMIGSEPDRFLLGYFRTLDSDSISTRAFNAESNYFYPFFDRSEGKEIYLPDSVDNVMDVNYYGRQLHAGNGIRNGDMAAKKGGMIFRVDDQGTEWYRIKWSRLFDRYGFPCTWAMNSALNLDDNYKEAARDYQRRGHELLDHTPSHSTEYFVCATASDTARYSGQTGIDSITSDLKVYLTRSFPDTLSQKVDPGTVKTYSGTNKIKTTGMTLHSLGFIWIDDTRDGWYGYAKVTDDSAIAYWRGSNSFTFGATTTKQLYEVPTDSVCLTPEATYWLMFESIKQWKAQGFEAPRIWIQPGGPHPNVHYDSLAWAGDRLGYIGGESTYGVENGNGSYANAPERTTYNLTSIVNPEWRTNWGEIRLHDSTFAHWKPIIADGVAKHWLMIEGSHFTDWGGVYDAATDALKFEQFLRATDSTLCWLHENNIPVGTYADWNSQLFKKPSDPYYNIMPPLSTDLDGDSDPDGWTLDAGATWASSGGLQEDGEYCLTSGATGAIAYIYRLGGIEKGYNEFSIWLKGAAGDSVQVLFDADSGTDYTLQFPAVSGTWTRFAETASTSGTTAINFDKDCNYVTVWVMVSDYSSGTVSVGGMELRKKRW
jgi:hypothetical protein